MLGERPLHYYELKLALAHEDIIPTEQGLDNGGVALRSGRALRLCHLSRNKIATYLGLRPEAGVDLSP